MYWPSIPKEFVQIIHVGDCHWACLSNKLCKEDNIVELYDSLHMKPGDTVKEQVSTIMNCEVAAIIIRVMNIERQRSGHACGLYAIAVAVDLCLGNDPCSSLYDEENMRNHLELCFRKRAIAQFPQEFRDTSQRVLKEISVPVYCICHYPDCTTCFGDMVCCDSCGQWLHERCLCIQDIKALKSKWFCFRCAKQYVFVTLLIRSGTELNLVVYCQTFLCSIKIYWQHTIQNVHCIQASTSTRYL